MMGQIFSMCLILYAVLSMALLPMIAVDSYFKARDCKARHDVDQCVIIYAPKEGGDA